MEAFCANFHLVRTKIVLFVLELESNPLLGLESSSEKHIFCMKHEENVRILPSFDHGILSQIVSSHKLSELFSIDRLLWSPPTYVGHKMGGGCHL